MARVTVEDCIVHVPNRFELVLLASQRAKQISSGNPLTIERDNDKDAVVSLREIADRTELLSPNGDLRTLPMHFADSDPEHGGLDGFYAARLLRRI